MSTQRFGRYELLKRLGAGGMAEVHVARVVSELDGVDKFVVIKRLLPEHAGNQEYIDMFLDEARTASCLNHPNVVQMHDCGAEAGRHYIAMEYLHGEDVRGIIKGLRGAGRAMPLARAVQICAAVCAGLHHAHEAVDRSGKPLSIVHRDVSPQNVLVGFDGSVRVVDFGIAKSTNRKSETRHGTLKGKVPYMSPEQLRTDGTLDRRSDVYAVGVMMFEMLFGQRPYLLAAKGEFALMMAISQHNIRRPTELDPSFPQALERILLKAMAPDRATRYATAQAMQEDLERFARAENLDLSTTALRRFMRDLFGDRAEAWRSAQGSSQELVAHLVATAGERPEDDEDDDPVEGQIVAASYGIEASMRELSGIQFWTLSGKLSESFQGSALGQDLRGTVVLDLAGVERISSFGVREWMAMLDASKRRAEAMFLARCSEAFVNQLSMIRAFCGNARVVSFLAPYLCSQCGRARKHLFDCERDAAALSSGQMPEIPCDSCGGSCSLDDDPNAFACLAPHLGVAPPPPVRAALDAAARDASASAEIEKSIKDSVTTVTVRKPIDRTVRWARVLDGAEGALVLDLSSAGKTSPEGAQGLAQALRSLADDIAEIGVVGMPSLALAALARVPPRVEIRSISFEGHCPSCNGPRGSLVAPEDLSSPAPSFPCRRCGSDLERVDFQAAQRVIFPDAAPSAPPAAPPAAVATPAAPSSPSTPPPATASAPPASPSAPASGARRLLPAVALLGGLGVLGALGLALGDATVRSVGPAAAPSAAPSAASAASATATAGMLPDADEGVLKIEGGSARVLAAGQGESEAQALQAARARAMTRFAEAARARLKNPAIVAFLGAQKNEAAPAEVAARWLRIAGAVATPERQETRSLKEDGRVRVQARYALSDEALGKAVALLDASAQVGGATVAFVFPLLPGGPDEGDLVVVEAGGAAARAGVQVGDRLLAIGGQPTPTLDAVTSLVKGAARAPSLSLDLRSGDARRTVKVSP